MAFPSTTFLNIPAVASGVLPLGIGEIGGVYFEQDVAQIYGGSTTDKILNVERTMRMRVQCWGAGGGGGYAGGTTIYRRGGGGGEYREGTFILEPGEYTLLVGTSGKYGRSATSGYGGAGSGAVTNSTSGLPVYTRRSPGVDGIPWAGPVFRSPNITALGYTSGGGGMVGLFESTTKSQATSLIIAGGGGGGGFNTVSGTGGGSVGTSGGYNAGSGAGGDRSTGSPTYNGGGGGGGYIGGNTVNGTAYGGEGFTHASATNTVTEAGTNGNASVKGEVGGQSADNYNTSYGDGGYGPSSGQGGLMALTLLAWE